MVRSSQHQLSNLFLGGSYEQMWMCCLDLPPNVAISVEKFDVSKINHELKVLFDHISILILPVMEKDGRFQIIKLI